MCVSVCMWVCVSVCVYVFESGSVWVCVFVCMCVWVCVCAYARYLINIRYQDGLGLVFSSFFFDLG